MTSQPLHIEYESLGDPSHPAIVLIMGLGMQLMAWPDTFCQQLVARGYRVLRFDNRDCGLSGRAPGKKRANLLLAMAASALGLPVRTPYTLDDMAGDAIGLMDRLGIAQAHIVGASMGGMIAQVLAAKFPQRVLSLTSIMSSSGYRKVSKPTKPARKVLLSRPTDPKDPESVIAYMVEMFGVIGSPAYPNHRLGRPSQAAAHHRRADTGDPRRRGSAGAAGRRSRHGAEHSGCVPAGDRGHGPRFSRGPDAAPGAGYCRSLRSIRTQVIPRRQPNRQNWPIRVSLPVRACPVLRIRMR
ncbi:MAG: alpha/beta hydrolase [Rhodocyclales bacterium]|nr:alpha/beta hydrolase [Rhodocyclales bacterium]